MSSTFEQYAIAIAYGGSKGILPFSKADYFQLYQVTNGKITMKRMLSLFPEDNEDCIHELEREGISRVVAANFSPRVLSEMKDAGLKAYMFTGGPHAALKAVLKGESQPLNG